MKGAILCVIHPVIPAGFAASASSEARADAAFARTSGKLKMVKTSLPWAAAIKAPAKVSRLAGTPKSLACATRAWLAVRSATSSACAPRQFRIRYRLYRPPGRFTVDGDVCGRLGAPSSPGRRARSSPAPSLFAPRCPSGNGRGMYVFRERMGYRSCLCFRRRSHRVGAQGCSEIRNQSGEYFRGFQHRKVTGVRYDVQDGVGDARQDLGSERLDAVDPVQFAGDDDRGGRRSRSPVA